MNIKNSEDPLSTHCFKIRLKAQPGFTRVKPMGKPGERWALRTLSFSEINKNGVFCRKFFSQFFPKCCLPNIFKVVNNFNRVFTCNFFNESFYNDIYMKYTQFLKLLLASIAKLSSVAKF